MRAPLFVLLAGCAHRGGFPGPTRHMGWEPPRYADTVAPASSGAGEDVAARGGGAAVARSAARLVGEDRLVVRGDTYRYDCSGMVIAAHADAGWKVSGSSADLFEYAREQGVVHHRRRPEVGDVAFFDQTYDRNGNGRRDDELTHVAIVEAVDGDGTITLIHLGSQGVVRIAMNLRHPRDAAGDDGSPLNDPLRATRDNDGGAVLTGELWRAFGSLWAAEAGRVAFGCPAYENDGTRPVTG